MKVLVIGSGGREHVLCWSLATSPEIEQLYCAPGNAGIAGQAECVALDVMDFDGILAFCTERGIGFVVIGPEAPLVSGLADRLEAAGIAAFGPSAAAARLEGSKGFMKDLCAKYDIPTAGYGRFTSPDAAKEFIRDNGAPIVVKADGLAAGKGVVLAADEDEAIAAVRDMLGGGRFGEAGRRVVVEEFLEGEEASFIALVDGENVLPLASSQDHKAAYDGDTGPNTGGMGAYSPAPVVTAAVAERAMAEVIRPTVAGMAAEGRPFTGFLYAGLMIGADGTPKVLEFNVRLGDPEAQPLLMRLRSDLVELVGAALEGRLDRTRIDWDPRAALGVVMAAGGYPGDYRKGDAIAGLGDDTEDTKVFHAGTALADGRVVTAGGRVLCVCALGDDVAEARRRAYDRADAIRWSDVHYRRDIGYRALNR